MMNMKIAPSILSADFSDLGNQLRECEQGGAELIHYDVMDGFFVPEISYGEPVLRSLKKFCSLPFDVHLMVEHPEKNIESFVKSGADMITVHTEACENIGEAVRLIRSFGIPAALSIKPKTPVETLFPYLDDLSMVLMMTVEPGYGGQAFIMESCDRIRKLRDEIERRGLTIDIEVDGGINKETAAIAAKAGANVFVSGSTVFKGDIEENIKALRKAVSEQ